MLNDCILFVPQVQTRSGQWLQVGIPASSYNEALAQESNFPLNNKLIAFRVIQTSCSEQRIRKSCCGG